MEAFEPAVNGDSPPSGATAVLGVPEALAILADELPDGLVVHDRQQILYANRRALALLGEADLAPARSRPLAAYLPADDGVRVRREIDQVLAGDGEHGPSVERIIRRGGPPVEVEVTHGRVDLPGRSVLRTVIRGVGDRRRAERALQASEERYRELFDGVPLGLYQSTVAGRLLSVNTALVRMLRYPDRQTLLNTPVTRLYTDPGERESWKRIADRDGVVNGREIHLRRYDGSTALVRLSARVVRGDAGEIRIFEGALEDVTEQRRAEESYRLLYETMAQGVVYHGSDGSILSANPAAERILGRYDRDLVGRGMTVEDWDVIRSDGSEWPVQEFPAVRAMREGRAIRAELMGIYNPETGERRWIDLESIPLFHRGDSRPHQVYSLVIDVTARHRAEEELRRSEQRLERALAGSGLGLWDWSLATGEIYLDDRWYRMLGYAPGEFTLHYGDWVEMVHPDDRDGVLRQLDGHLSGELPHYQCEYRFRTKDGGWRWILDRGQVVERDGDGRPLRAAGTHTDVEERKRADDALRRSEERLATIFRAAPLGITLSRVSDGLLLEVNDAFAERSGRSREDLVGVSSLALGMWVDPTEREAVVEELVRKGHLRGATVHLRHADGVVREIQLFTELLTVDGEPCALTLHRDVTDARRLEEQLRQAQKMEAVGRLAGGVAHDFNNLLTAMSGHIRFLLESMPEGDLRRADAEGVAASAERAKRLTRQLLAFSRQQVLRPRVVDLDEVIASFHPLLARLIGEDVVLEVERSKEPCRIRVDPGQLEQVVLNLAVNARDAMPDGGLLRIRSACVELEGGEVVGVSQSVPAGRYARFDVSDTGAGMDEKTRARIFEPFFTTKPAGKGTGLGLATVYGIVEQSEGYIGVVTGPGQGTTFTIYLPAVDGSEAERAPAEPRSAGEPECCRERVILVVEDEAAVRGVARRALEKAGYTVHVASEGGEALAKVDSLGRLDLLVTDMVMPGMGGRELADRLRDRLPDLPVLYMSGYTAEEVVRDVRQPRSGFLPKPFTPNDLAGAVREALDR